MGHSLATWQAKVADTVQDRGNKDLAPSDIESIGLRPALAQFSTDRPRVVVAESAGTGSPYLALPAGWSGGWSHLLGVEHPARRNPPEPLDPRSWMLVRSAADVAVEQILLDRTPAATEWVRLRFTAPWPFPTTDATVDKIDDVAYEAVAALAASFCELSLASQAARARMGALPTDFADGRERARLLTAAAEAHRDVYERFLGLSTGGDGGQAPGAAPAHGRLDLDPSRASLFHGGVR